MNTDFQRVTSKSLVNLSRRVLVGRGLLDHFSGVMAVREFLSGNTLLVVTKYVYVEAVK